jgi:drug/metabolite transporter (DMT)-like permease
MAIAWVWLVDGHRPTAWDVVAAAVTLAGMAIIMGRYPSHLGRGHRIQHEIKDIGTR